MTRTRALGEVEVWLTNSEQMPDSFLFTEEDEEEE